MSLYSSFMRTVDTAQAAELQQWQHHCLTSGAARCEVALHGCGTSLVYLFYTIAIVFQLYHGGDKMYEMRRRKPEPTLLQIFNLPHDTGVV